MQQTKQTTDPSIPFFPRTWPFWLCHIAGWLFLVDRVYVTGHSVGVLLEPGHSPGFWAALAYAWLGHMASGILMTLVFRHYYFRKAWGNQRPLATLPLALVLALLTGMLQSVLVQWPVDEVTGTSFRVYREGGAVFIADAPTFLLYRGASLGAMCLLWLLAYWGVSVTLHAREQAFRSLALENSLKEARLNALSGQINPHFLFNALNNIRFMIAADTRRAEDSLVALSGILRHSLDSSRKEKVPLAEELAITEQYLSLMKNQMRERLVYSIQGGKEAGAFQIPPMIIQMLAENAIKHGLEQSREGGRVDIACAASGGTLRVEVRNTAAQPDQEAGQRQLNAAPDATAENGLGLTNIRNRLYLLYGERALMSLSHRGDEFVVVLELPGEHAA